MDPFAAGTQAYKLFYHVKSYFEPFLLVVKKGPVTERGTGESCTKEGGTNTENQTTEQ